MAESIFFYLFSSLAIATALMVIFSKEPVTSVLYLVVTMFALAALFALLGAIFLAVIQILIYAGAILVLFLFIVMMLDLSKEGPSMRQTAELKIVGWVTATAFIAEIIFLVRTSAPDRALTPALCLEGSGGGIEAIGRVLFCQHLLAFELASFLMLAAIVGVVVLSKKKWS